MRSVEMSHFASTILNSKYAHKKPSGQKETWDEIANRVATCITQNAMPSATEKLYNLIFDRKFLPGGRYLYAAGRKYPQINNCYLFIAEDSREGWGDVMTKITNGLMTGGGVGVVYSNLRGKGSSVGGMGGESTGPCALAQMVNEAGRHIMQGGARRCLPGETKIYLQNGTTIPIGLCEADQFILTRHGFKKILAKESSGVQPVYEITTEYGSVRATDNHRWLAARNDRCKNWYETRQLKPGHKIYYHPIPEGEGKSYNTNQAYTMGYFMGDGCAYHSGRTHEITFQFSSEWYSEDQERLISQVMRQLGTSPILRPGHGNYCELRCRSKNLVDNFQKWKTPNLAPVVPAEIWEASLQARCAFLAGWMDADGYYGEDSWKLANKHESTRKDLCRLFESVGIATTLDAMEVRLSSYQRAYIKQVFAPCSVKLPAEAKCKPTSEIPAKILAIKYVGKEEVWDIQVDEVEEFIADNFVSHNSAIWAGLNWKHADIDDFITLKDWSKDVQELKRKDFNFPATMDGTNISVGLDTEFISAIEDSSHDKYKLANKVYWSVVDHMCKTGEPGFSIDAFDKEGEVARNAPVAGSTTILTDKGYKQVIDVVDKPITIWTGLHWADNVVFKKTKSNTKTLKVSFNGNYVVADPDHEFKVVVSGTKAVTSVKAKDLKPGDKLKVSLPRDWYKYGRDIKLNKSLFSSVIKFDDQGSPSITYNLDACTSIDDLISCVRGIFACLGRTNKQSDEFGIEKINNCLIDCLNLPVEEYKMLSRALLRLGVDNSANAGQNSITVSLNHDNIAWFYSNIMGLGSSFLLEQQCHDSYRTVSSVEEDVDQDVYCCDVNKPEHSFMANGVIVSNCTEVTSADDSDMCNLGSLNLARFSNIDEFEEAVYYTVGFLICGTLYSPLPIKAMYKTREKNRRLGLGLMGIHEWLLRRGKPYGEDSDLENWLKVYAKSGKFAAEWANKLGISVPVATRAIAPTGTIAIIAETTSGIEPIFAVAQKRRYLSQDHNNTWKYQYIVDACAKRIIDSGVDPNLIEDAYDLAEDYERRIKMQAWIQQYVDHGISSTINMPQWGSSVNNEGTIKNFGNILLKYIPKLRGITVYPDGARGGQPLNRVKYQEAVKYIGKEFTESGESVSVGTEEVSNERACVNGVCGI